MDLSKKQISWLRSRAHPLAPLLQLGKQGLNEGFLAKLEEGLERQELVKIKMGKLVEVDVPALAEQVNATVVQKVGRMFVLFRRAQEPKLELPR